MKRLGIALAVTALLASAPAFAQLPRQGSLTGRYCGLVALLLCAASS